MKVLVLGATGMAGHIISIYLKETGHNVTGFSRRKFKHCHNIVGDVTNLEFLRGLAEGNNYDFIINAIGILNKEAESYTSQAVLLNSYLPHFLSDVTRNMSTKVIHISTDCVFLGKDGGYKETSFRDADSFYGRSKALGEIDNDNCLTIRTSIIGPDLEESGIGLFNWFMKQNGKVKGYDKAIWTGVTTLTLAKAIERAFFENVKGIYNLVNAESISKFSLLTLFNNYMRDGDVLISSSDDICVNKSLINSRTDFSFIVPSYEDMVCELKEWMLCHKQLYPHYYNFRMNERGGNCAEA